MGGAVAEWSKALLLREKIYENHKIPGSPPGLGTFLKKLYIVPVAQLIEQWTNGLEYVSLSPRPGNFFQFI